MMCFSAAASFTAAGTISIIGITALTRVNEARELPLASIPILFAIQQGIEGLLWLKLPTPAPILTLFYLLFAEVFWPIYAAIAVLLIEPNEHRQGLMAICLISGVALAGYMIPWLFTQPYIVTVADGHIAYLPKSWPRYALGVAYVITTGLPLLLSSQRNIFIFGIIVLTGLIVARKFYHEAFISVWCFFAAIASIMILIRTVKNDRSLKNIVASDRSLGC